MIGQKMLLNTINTFKVIPHAIAILGEDGSEQEDICDYISCRFNLHKIEFDNISLVDSVHSLIEPTMYVINIKDYSLSDQNKLLKILEEPTEFAYFIIIGKEINLISTIYTRCYILHCDLYSSCDLLPLISKKNDSELILRICRTPGLIEKANNCDVNKLYSLCNDITKRIETSSFYNFIAISNLINFSDEYDKYDLLLFIKTFKQYLLDSMINSIIDCKLCTHCFKLLNDLDSRIWPLTYKKNYFDNFLINLWSYNK